MRSVSVDDQRYSSHNSNGTHFKKISFYKKLSIA